MMRLSAVAAAVGGRLTGADRQCTRVSTDSRKISGGELFVALCGERFDGHDFVAECLQRGAAAALVSKAPAPEACAPMVVVEDTHVALGRLAAWWRSRFRIPLAGITGSSGKTTVKDMLAAILRCSAGDEAAVLATRGNLNNEIGVPLTLLELRETHRYAAVEMGMNHVGEIGRLAAMAQPTVALVNNALPAHLAGLGSVDNVARAKGEIFSGLAADGIAVINADDAHAPLWRQLAAPRRVLTFGMHPASDVQAGYCPDAAGGSVTLSTPQGRWTVRLAVPGAHSAANAAAATAVALGMGATPAAIVAGLEAFRPAPGRLHRREAACGATVIDDTYNANPASMRAAMDVLAACPGRRVLVLGDMGELGADAEQWHAAVGAYAAERGLDAVYTLGELARAYGGHHFESPEALADRLLPLLDARTTVLVKGSRFMRMERVVDLLVERREVSHAA